MSDSLLDSLERFAVPGVCRERFKAGAKRYFDYLRVATADGGSGVLTIEEADSLLQFGEPQTLAFLEALVSEGYLGPDVVCVVEPDGTERRFESAVPGVSTRELVDGIGVFNGYLAEQCRKTKRVFITPQRAGKLLRIGTAGATEVLEGMVRRGSFKRYDGGGRYRYVGPTGDLLPDDTAETERAA